MAKCVPGDSRDGSRNHHRILSELPGVYVSVCLSLDRFLSAQRHRNPARYSHEASHVLPASQLVKTSMSFLKEEIEQSSF